MRIGDRHRRARSAAATAAIIALAGCIARPAEQFDRQAAALNLHSGRVLGEGFEHVVYRKPGSSEAGVLHIYLDGDGNPWMGRWPAPDPTSRHSLTLALMARDQTAAVYLGRPCYHGLDTAPGCNPELWTRGRYSETVVASMAAAVRRIVEQERIGKADLIGHSGGGTLAMLVAERVPETTAVVTVAANLDTEAWARRRGEDLSSSLNPARRPPLPAAVRQLHYIGDRDAIVPSDATAAGQRAEAPAAVVVVPGYDHVCCWQDIWASVLADLDRRP